VTPLSSAGSTYVTISSQNVRGLKKTGKEAEVNLRIKEWRLLAAMSQETWEVGIKVRENQGITSPQARTGDEGLPPRAPGRYHGPGAGGQCSQGGAGTSRLAAPYVRSANPTPCNMTHRLGPRPIKLLGPPRAFPQPAPTGQAPVVYAARCLHVPPGSNS
jgi:hypothetical protein